MKYVVILPDGASDQPVASLGNKTPLEVAKIPHMDSIARHGVLGRVVTIPKGYVAGTDVGTLTLLGHDPHCYYSGRAPIEARARGLHATPDQLIVRCNFVHIDQGRMKDFTAGHISQADADALITSMQQGLSASHQCVFHAGVSYRNLLFLAQAAHMKLQTTPPHDISGQLIDRYLPHGEEQERIRALMQEAERLLADHPVNRRRRDLKENWATHIWLWGQGVPVALEPLESLGLKGAVITAVDIIRGIALGMGMEFIPVPGATGYIDTDYQAKGRAAIRALEEYDLVVVHIEAPDESAHQGMIEEKVKSLERIDEAIIGPILEQLSKYKEYRILVAADHATLLNSKGHNADPPPFAYAGTGVTATKSERGFSEKDALATRLLVEPGHTLWKRFLKDY